MNTFFNRALLAATLAITLASCGSQTSVSSSKIVNGTEAFYFEQPAIVTLYDRELDAICTGAFISDTQVLTAAHCTEGNSVNFQTGEVNGKLHIAFIDKVNPSKSKIVATSTRIIRNPAWDKAGSGVNSADLAIIVFPKGTWGTKAKISKRQARVGDEVEMFGYGLNQNIDSSDNSSTGVFRKGFNTIEEVSGGFIAFEGYNYNHSGDGSFATAGHGDSGGPLFVNGEIVGVVSGGSEASDDNSTATAYYVDLHSDTSVGFLAHALKM